jgi:MoxR-like ATPase
MFKLKITYPKKSEEIEIMERMSGLAVTEVNSVVDPKDILRAREVVRSIYIDDKVKQYIVNIVCASRDPEAYQLKDLKGLIMYGASPRASIYLNVASKAYAFMKGRGYVTPDDVKAIGMDVLRHRVIPSYEAEAEEKTSETIVQRIFEEIEVP